MKATIVKLYLILVPLLLVNVPVAHSDENYKVVNNPLYKEECGSCHLAYSPGMLPASSWQKIMGSLNSHFGDTAELDPVKQKELTQYLMDNSANGSKSRQAAGDKAIRITQQPWFLHEHDEIPARLSIANPAVKSFSNCAACHQRAEQGSFREREINIPGYGRWED